MLLTTRVFNYESKFLLYIWLIDIITLADEITNLLFIFLTLKILLPPNRNLNIYCLFVLGAFFNFKLLTFFILNSLNIDLFIVAYKETFLLCIKI